MLATPTAPALFPPIGLRPIGGPYGCVPALGSTRRLRAFAADGWPIRTLAGLTGVSARTLPKIRAAERDWVTVSIATRITEVYAVLGGRNPDQVLPRTSAAVRAIHHTRVTALRAGWATVDDWAGLDLDDPAAAPTDGARDWRDDRLRNTTAGELLDLIEGRVDLDRRAAAWNRMRGDQKRIVVETLYGRGLRIGDVADLIGVDARNVQRYRDTTRPSPRPQAPCPRSMLRKTEVAA